MKFAISPLVLALALAAPAANAATEMFRSVMPDGSVRYGESPERGAKSVTRIPPPPASTGTITVTPQEKARSFAPPEPGSTVVLPLPERKRPEAAEQGRTQTPERLPGSTY